MSILRKEKGQQSGKSAEGNSSQKSTTNVKTASEDPTANTVTLKRRSEREKQKPIGIFKEKLPKRGHGTNIR